MNVFFLCYSQLLTLTSSVHSVHNLLLNKEVLTPGILKNMALSSMIWAFIRKMIRSCEKSQADCSSKNFKLQNSSVFCAKHRFWLVSSKGVAFRSMNSDVLLFWLGFWTSKDLVCPSWNFHPAWETVSSGCSCEAEFIGTINIGAKPEERTEEEEEEENKENGQTQISMRVHIYRCLRS